jgi:ribonucleoside-triphosphate reductase
LFDHDDTESLLAKYGINGFWSEKHFQQHEKVRGLLIKNGIAIPEWFDGLGEKKYVVFYNKTEQKFFDTKEEADLFAEQRQEQQPFVSFPANEGRKGINHRRMSNNSVAFEKKPTREQHELQFALLQGEGEPCFINLEEARRRRPNAEGLNPCAEILLDSKSLCNLTTINVVAFVLPDGKGGYYLDLEGLLEAQRLSTRAGVRMTLVTLELEDFDKTQKRDRLIGTSMTGWKDAMAVLRYSKEQQDELLETLGKVSRNEADRVARILRIPSPLLATTVKPEGTLSQVAKNPVTKSPVSSGLHISHAPFFIRRIRINSNDPLAKVAKTLGWTINPEVGTEGATHEERMANATTWVIDFPVASGADKTKDDITVREQFDTYFQFQEKYTEHNSSNTISVKDGEWDIAEQIVWDRWDDFVGVSFLSHDGGTYQLAPYTTITEEKYHELRANMKDFDPELLQLFEQAETEADLGTDGCETGICPVR